MNAHDIYEKAYELWNPNKVDMFRGYGFEMVMGEREGSVFHDLDGHAFINMHSNGGVFNLGHKNAEIMDALIQGAQKVDAGNHYFPSQYKNDLCQALLDVSPDNMKYVFFLNGGGEANDAAIKFAIRATGRRRIVSLDCAFHGSTGLSMMAGEENMVNFFNMEVNPNHNTHIPYNDLDALEAILQEGDTAAVLIETIPATAGFPLPIEGYHQEVQRLAHRYGALYIADEVQTGLMRSGEMWCSVKYGAEPDIITTGKGLSGGYYPMSAVIMNEKAGGWLREDGFAHVSSFNAAELGCIVSLKAMEIMTRPSTKENIDSLTAYFGKEVGALQQKYSDFFQEFRQCGVIMGLKTAHPMGGMMLMQTLIQNGVWCVMANFDKSTLQFKPGLLMEEPTAREVVQRLDYSLSQIMAKV